LLVFRVKVPCCPVEIPSEFYPFQGRQCGVTIKRDNNEIEGEPFSAVLPLGPPSDDSDHDREEEKNVGVNHASCLSDIFRLIAERARA